MNEGYLYILFSPALRSGQYKIGKTTRLPEERAKELSNATGVPEPFEVLYEERVVDCHIAEAMVHERLRKHRTPSGKEFFTVDLKEAVLAVAKSAEEVGRLPLNIATNASPSSIPSYETSSPDRCRTDTEIDLEPPPMIKHGKNDSSREATEYLRFWTYLLDKVRNQTQRFENIRPGPYYHRTMISVRPKIDYYFTLNKKSIRVELFMATSDREYNREIFELLEANKLDIEEAFGKSLQWQRHAKNCGIKYFFASGDYRREEDWNALTEDALDILIKFESAVNPYIKRAVSRQDTT